MVCQLIEGCLFIPEFVLVLKIVSFHVLTLLFSHSFPFHPPIKEDDGFGDDSDASDDEHNQGEGGNDNDDVNVSVLWK